MKTLAVTTAQHAEYEGVYLAFLGFIVVLCLVLAVVAVVDAVRNRRAR